MRGAGGLMAHGKNTAPLDVSVTLKWHGAIELFGANARAISRAQLWRPSLATGFRVQRGSGSTEPRGGGASALSEVACHAMRGETVWKLRC